MEPQTEDGKWNYVLYDTDGALGYFKAIKLPIWLRTLFTNEHSQMFVTFYKSNF